jgi:hypothetical protein
VQFDATLNVAWAILGLLALCATAHAAMRQKERRTPRWLLVVGLIVTALFPYVSASDDILRIEHHRGAAVPTSTHVSDHSNNRSQQSRHSADDLLRLYETLDTPLVCQLYVVQLSLSLVAFITVLEYKHTSRAVPEGFGRSPPLLPFCC